MRSTCDVFCPEAAVTADAEGSRLTLRWETEAQQAELSADFADLSFSITVTDRSSGESLFRFVQK